MPFEIVPTPHLPPHTCICCGCAKDEPHAFIPQAAPWEYNYPFLCRTCVTEMADAMGITKETVTTTVEVVREPTEAEILAVIGARYMLLPRQVLTEADLHPALPSLDEANGRAAARQAEVDEQLTAPTPLLNRARKPTPRRAEGGAADGA